jgi:Na+-transporting NADH:ubiquinone oxidoreductase subunit F
MQGQLGRPAGGVRGLHAAYLCGSPGMIDASIKVFKAKGLPDELIFYDKFA